MQQRATRRKANATERAVISALRWGHITLHQAVAKLGTSRARNLGII